MAASTSDPGNNRFDSKRILRLIDVGLLTFGTAYLIIVVAWRYVVAALLVAITSYDDRTQLPNSVSVGAAVVTVVCPFFGAILVAFAGWHSYARRAYLVALVASVVLTVTAVMLL